MKNRKFEKSVLLLFLGLFAAAGAVFTVLLGKTYREYTNIKVRQVEIEEIVSRKEAQLKDKEEKLYRLRHDQEFVERVIRQRLGYAKPGELVFRFEQVEENSEARFSP